MGINYTEKIIGDYISEKVSDALKDNFIDAAVHFNISPSICTKHDLMRIEYRFKNIKDEDVYQTFKLYSVYSYILYRAVEVGNVKDEHRLCISQSVLCMSSLITGYATMKYDDSDIIIGFKDESVKLGITEEFDEKIKSRLFDI
ncbi:MAG: hypothetical protein ACRC68_09170 [Clostridium sp.]